MLPDRVSNPGPLTYESGALPIALRGPAGWMDDLRFYVLFNSMSCDFMSYLTACQSYQDDSWVVMKGYEQWNPIYD